MCESNDGLSLLFSQSINQLINFYLCRTFNNVQFHKGTLHEQQKSSYLNVKKFLKIPTALL